MLIILAVVSFLGLYRYNTTAVSDKTDSVSIEIKEGNNYYTISSLLKENNLIKSEFFYKVFLKIHKPMGLITGIYELNESMSVSEIVETLSNKNNLKDASIKITFKEGIKIVDMASIIEQKTGISKDEFISTINNDEYINTLISKYWFITDDVKNTNLYYKLEGYLFPDTYIFGKDELNSKIIIQKILENTKEKLTPFKQSIENSGYSIHEILTLASIVELEAVTDDDRANVAGVFYNRLNNSWALGSDVTTYYAAKKSMTESLTKAELNDCNGYNTRCTSMKGLPIGPICNPSLSSINATINPTSNNYYYFVADSEKKVYFTKNATEHANIIAKLKKEGKWIG